MSFAALRCSASSYTPYTSSASRLAPLAPRPGAAHAAYWNRLFWSLSYAPVLSSEVPRRNRHGDVARLRQAVQRLPSDTDRHRELERVSGPRPDLLEGEARLEDGAHREDSPRF